jgi:hypothetical protein
MEPEHDRHPGVDERVEQGGSGKRRAGPLLLFAMTVTVPRATYFRAAFSFSTCVKMSRRAHSTTPEPRPAKRPRGDARPLTSDDYKDGVMLAPMVRSGARAYS